MNRILSAPLLASSLALGFLALPLPGAETPPFDESILDALPPRPLGPANMGGRITGVAVVEKRPTTMYLATASGGLWKTVNNGTTWKAVFDQAETVSLGDVAVAPSDPETVWVGTGEANARNSVSWGDGVYKSTDGGKTWQHLGLKDSAHIGRIVIHPKNPDIVYVAVLGDLWGPSKERGLYRTADGGRSWQQVKFINEDTGFIDLAMDPGDPDIMYGSAYTCRRDAFDGGNPAVQTGPGAGLYKSIDAGKTWNRMSKGLSDRPLGRCGLAIYRKDPRILYAVIQTDKTPTTTAGQPAKTGNNPESGGIFRSEDRGETWTKVNDLVPRPFYFGQIRIDPNDDRRIYVLGVSLHVSDDGGKTFRNDGARGVHPDQHALWVDPRDSDHLVLGNDGGLYFSYDRGLTWEHLNQMPIGQFYGVAVDMRRPYRVYGGLQDNGTWGGPSATRNPDGITLANWFKVLGADGFACQVDPGNPDTVYTEAQFGSLFRVDVGTGEKVNIRLVPARRAPAYRFNWNSPLMLSPHNPRTLYYGGNVLFRSPDRGDQWGVISPDLTRGKPGPSPDFGHTITAIAESPLKPGLLYVGTDDGRVHVSPDGGGTWNDLSDKIPGLPADRWITRIECSHFAEGTAYLSIDRHRNADYRPFVFKTADRGSTWEPITGNLPAAGPIHVIREDLSNRDLLFAGTEFGLFVSVNGGGHWHPVRKNFPTVAVHDLVIHPRDRELVIATHGRGMYVMDIAPLEELTPKVLEAAHLCDVKPATQFYLRGSHGWTGSRFFAAPNPPYGAGIYYYLKSAPPQPVKLTIADALGSTVAELKAPSEPGLHRVTWNLGLSSSDSQAPPGDYVARLKVGERVLAKKFRILPGE